MTEVEEQVIEAAVTYVDTLRHGLYKDIPKDKTALVLAVYKYQDKEPEEKL